MFIDERTLLVDVAFVANGVAAWHGPQLPHCSRAVRIVAVIALHQALVNAVVVWFREIRLGGCVASVAQLGLVLD
jgi:hypothetical protein